jgi:hypothetical protein
LGGRAAGAPIPALPSFAVMESPAAVPTCPTACRKHFQISFFSIHKRDWSLKGFAPSPSLSATRNHSTLPIYEEKRVRGEIRLTRAF